MKKYIPRHYRILALRLCIPLVLLTITRILFYIFNRESFTDVTVLDFLSGVWFDLITTSLFYLPYAILYLLPAPIRHYRLFRLSLKVLFLITTALLVAMNLMDIEYFSYTSK